MLCKPWLLRSSHIVSTVLSVVRNAIEITYKKKSEARVESTYVPRSEDGSVPVAHHDVVAIGESVAAGAIANALLALLELFHQLEITGN